MKIIFDEIKNKNLLPEEVVKLKENIPKLEPYFEENLSNYFQFLTEQEKKGDYLEVHWPFFEFGITLILSKIKEKFLISILNYNDVIIYGNLKIEGYDCVSNHELKKLGEWKNYSKNKLKIFKPF